jgi:(4-O-methyl)-D-glucuronate---lignin esterase
MNTYLMAVIATCVAALSWAMAALPAADDLPQIATLPDPFVFADGSRVKNADDWQRRRDELKDMFENYEYGHLPPKPQNMTVDRDPVEHNADLGVDTQTLTLTLHNGDRQMVMHVRLSLPTGATGRLPVVIQPYADFQPPPDATDEQKQRFAQFRDRMKQFQDAAVKLFTSRGYVFAEFNLNDVAPDNADQNTGVYTLYDDLDCGVLMAWAWGFHRTIDALLQDPRIDPTKIAVTGHSRWGKAALVAGAFDERIALTVPSHSGCAGTAPYRYIYGNSEAIQNITGFAPYWFRSDFTQFVGKVDRLPFDQHELRALVAPRAQLSNEGLDDKWTNPEGSQLTYLAARRVYEFLGVPDNISLRYRPGGHIPNNEDLLDFADHVFIGKPLPPEFGQLHYPQHADAFPWASAQ